MKLNFSILFLAAIMLLSGPLGLSALEAPPPGSSYSYPLPDAGNFVNVVYTMAEPGAAQVVVYNEAGEKVLYSTETKAAGLQTTQFCLCPMPPGVYLYFTLLNYDSGKQERLKPGKIVVIH